MEVGTNRTRVAKYDVKRNEMEIEETCRLHLSNSSVDVIQADVIVMIPTIPTDSN